jgi:hypothetical protein
MEDWSGNIVAVLQTYRGTSIIIMQRIVDSEDRSDTDTDSAGWNPKRSWKVAVE